MVALMVLLELLVRPLALVVVVVVGLLLVALAAMACCASITKP